MRSDGGAGEHPREYKSRLRDPTDGESIGEQLVRIALAAAVLAAFSLPAWAQNTFPTPGGGTVPGVVLMCNNGNGQFIPCKITITPPIPPPVVITPTAITLSATAVHFPSTANANSFVATITVAATGGTYAGTLSLTGPDAGKFKLSNNGVYPTNLMVGAANLAAGSYNVSVTAP